MPQVISNGTFETGDISGWSEETPGYSVDGTTSQSGKFSLKMTGGAGGSIRQYFNPVEQANIIAFEVYYKMPTGAPGYGTGVVIIYEDDTTDEIACYGGTTNFTKIDLTTYLTPAKGRVKGVRLQSPGAVDAWFDSASLVALPGAILQVPDGSISIGGVSMPGAIVLDCSIHFGCTNEVSSFEIVLDRRSGGGVSLNPGQADAPENADVVLISLGRGTTIPLLLTGRTEEVEYIDEYEEESYRDVVIVRGRCKGYQLFQKKLDGDLIALVGTGYLNYNRTAGDASSLVAYLIDNYTSLDHTRSNSLLTGNANSGQKVVAVANGALFAAGDLVRIYDGNGWEYNKIDSIAGGNLTMVNNLVNNYTTAASAAVSDDTIEDTSTSFTEMIYSYTTIFEVLKFICETADLSGVIGFDMRIEYDGVFAFFAKNSKSVTYSIQDVCQINRYLLDAFRVKNRIKVFGKDDKPYPLEADGREYSDLLTETFSSTKAELAADANSGQANITLAAGQGAFFAANDYVWVLDTASMGELLQIDSINVDVLTMKTNLVNSYTTANYAVLWKVSATRGWGFIPNGSATSFAVGLSGSAYHTGSNSINCAFNATLASSTIVFAFLPTTKLDMTKYPNITGQLFFDTTAPNTFIVVLYSGSCTAAESAVAVPVRNLTPDEWLKFDVEGGPNHADNWVVGASFDWSDIQLMTFYVGYESAGSYSWFIDRLYAAGGRWGGGSDDADIDGFAEDATSQAKYGVQEHVVISDLLLSDAECEAKAQSLLDYYKDELIEIEVTTDCLDWGIEKLMAGDVAPVDLDAIGITGSSYRIETIDLNFRSLEMSLTATFVLVKAPRRIADYLFKLSQKVRELSRDYRNIR